MKVQRGDVVMVDFPYSDRTGSKVRPAVVLQSDRWNNALEDIILAPVTSSGKRRVNADTQLLIAVSSPTNSGTGLRMDSIVQCENLITYDQALIVRKIGELSAEQMASIDACLKSVLGLG